MSKAAGKNLTALLMPRVVCILLASTSHPICPQHHIFLMLTACKSRNSWVLLSCLTLRRSLSASKVLTQAALTPIQEARKGFMLWISEASTQAVELSTQAVRH